MLNNNEREAVVNLTYERLGKLLTNYGIESGELQLLQTVEIDKIELDEFEEDILQIFCRVVDPILQ